MGNAKREYGQALVAGLLELSRRYWQCDAWEREAREAGMPRTADGWYRHAEAIRYQKAVTREEFGRVGLDRTWCAREYNARQFRLQ